MTKKYALCGICAALMAICSWIGIPMGSVRVTLQTFAVVLTLQLLGGKWGTVSICCYLALGAVGAPVFSGFQGGIGALMGITGGFLWGFLAQGLCYWGFEKVWKPAGILLGQLLCYGLGCAWFCLYSGKSAAAGALVCVVPYLIPDAVKIRLAGLIARRLPRNF